MSLIRSLIYIAFAVVFFSVEALAQDPITFNIGSASGPQGSTQCIDFTVEDFIQVTSTQFVIRFDPNVVELDTPLVLDNSCLNADGMFGLSLANFNDQEIEDGFMNYIWFDLATTGVTLDDDCVLFTLCFDLIGDPCDETDICIAESSSVPFEFQQVDLVTGESYELPPIINKGVITIDPDGYNISTAFCSTDDASNSGSITFSGAGGTGPYEWMIEPGGFSGSNLADCDKVTIDNLAADDYTITLIDANNTVINEIVTISTNSDFPFILTLDGTDPTCFDNDNGSIEVLNIEGGEGPFTYTWSTFEFFEDELTGLGSGDYSLTVTDVNGCTTSASTSLHVDSLALMLEIVSDPSCDGMTSDGTISLTATGGNPFPGGEYEFEIDGVDGTFYFAATNGFPQSTLIAGNLPEGCFEAVAFDNSAIPCYSDPFEFCLEAGAFSNLDFDITDVSCNGECNGQAVITTSNFTQYNFTLTYPDGTVVNVTDANTLDEAGLCEGEYQLTVDDVDANCSLDTMFVINAPDLLVLSVIDSVGPGCGGGDGMISFGASGGTEDYTFEWNDSFDQPIRMNMEGGDYSVTVTDANGCSDSIAFSFAVGGDIGLSAIVCQAISCGGAMDGSVCASVNVGGSYTYSWEDSDGMDIGSGTQIDGLGGGIYFVTATDGMCTATDTVFLVPGPTPAVDVVQVDPTCADSNDGTLTATLVSGTSPPEFEWTEPPSLAILSDGAVLLDGVGTYNLHVTDAQGCELDTLIEMTPPTNLIQIDVSNIVANTCFGECGGEATFTASGGSAATGNYVFFISGVDQNIDPGGNVATVDVLCGGENWVYAIDGVCASDTFFFTVPDGEPISLNESTSIIEPPSCAGGDDGMITVEVQGGDNSSYDIFWVNEAISGPTLSGLAAGSYIYEATDGSNCVFTDTIELITPDALEVEVDPFSTTQISCSSDSNGRIGLSVSGGNSGTLTYDWDPDVSEQDFADNLGPGVYSVTVTDSKGCTAETSYELTSADPVQVVFNVPEEPECYGGQTCISIDTAYGGIGNTYTFQVNVSLSLPIDTCVSVFAGTHSISVSDSSGMCTLDTTIVIGQPEEVIVDLGPDVTINLGESTDPISAFIVSELDVDSIFWNPVSDLECNTLDCQVVTFSPLSTTDYTITVVDENGCSATDDITVEVDLKRNVFFPNIFTPDGDNQNDFFQLATGTGVREVTYFRLYDRWGNMVHEELGYMPDDSLHPGWDGTRNNKEVESGVYVFFAEVLFEDDRRILYKGDVTLIR